MSPISAYSFGAGLALGSREIRPEISISVRGKSVDGGHNKDVASRIDRREELVVGY